MVEALKLRDSYEFGRFRLEPLERALLLDGNPVPLTPKAFDLLLVLVARHGKIVGRDELMAAVWPNTFVEDSNLAFQISALRKVLGDGFIDTVPKRGYRFARLEEARPPDTGPEAAPSQDEPTARARPWVWWVAAALLAVVAGAAFLTFRFARSGPVRSVAVLPFKTPEGMEDLGLGLADALILRLGNSAQLRVRPTSAIYPFASTAFDPIQAGKQLGVDAIVTGMLQRSGDRIRATLQVIRVDDGTSLTSGQVDEDHFDQSGTELFELEDGLSLQVARALSARLTGQQRASLAERTKTDPETHRLVLLGRYQHFRQTQTSLKRSIEAFQQAVKRDERYAPAWAGLAKSLFGLAYLGGGAPHDLMPEARTAALKAIEIDPGLAQGHAALAFVRMWYDYDLPRAAESWRRAQALDPLDRDALDAQALDALFLRRFQESIDVRARILADNPTEPFSYVQVGRSLFFAGRYAEAHGYAQKALEVDPHYALAYTEEATVYRMERRFDQALAATLRQRQLVNADAVYSTKIREAFAAGGIKAWDQARLDDALLRIKDGKRVSAFGMASLYRDMGDHTRALDWLDKAYDERDPNLLVIGSFIPWRALDGAPRFQAMLKKLGLNSPGTPIS